MTTADLLDDLGADTDLARLVRRVSQEQLPWVVVSGAAIAGWMQRDPISDWLAAQGIALVGI